MYTGFIVIIDYMYLYLHWNCTCWCYFLLLSFFLFWCIRVCFFLFQATSFNERNAFLVAFQVLQHLLHCNFFCYYFVNKFWLIDCYFSWCWGIRGSSSSDMQRRAVSLRLRPITGNDVINVKLVVSWLSSLPCRWGGHGSLRTDGRTDGRVKTERWARSSVHTETDQRSTARSSPLVLRYTASSRLRSLVVKPIITGPPNRLFCFARWCLSGSVVVCNAAPMT